MSGAEVKNLIDKAPAFTGTTPEPLRKSAAKATKFPLDSLPPLIKESILAIHHKIEAPLPLCAQSVLAAANLAVQGHADIKLPYGQTRPISCFFMTIAESGERKTSSDMEALRSVVEREKALSEEYQKFSVDWKNKKEAWEQQRKQILNNRKEYREVLAKETALKALGDCPSEPLHPTIRVSDVTIEGVYRLMENGRPSLGLFSSEGGQFINGYGMKNEDRIKTAASLSALWDGEDVKRVRGGDGITILQGRRLCVHLMAQPLVALNFLSNPELRDQGLISRMLVSYPESTMGTRFGNNFYRENPALERFHNEMGRILKLKLPTKGKRDNELVPPAIEFDEKATKLFLEFKNHVERNLATGKIFENIRSFANKLLENAARLGITLLLVDDIQAERLDYDHFKIGIELAEYYASEALRLFDEGYTDPNIIRAEKLLKWLQDEWEEEHISLPDIYQNSSALNTKAKALLVVTILEEHGWLVKIHEQKLIKGKMRQDVWHINKGCDLERTNSVSCFPKFDFKSFEADPKLNNLASTLGALGTLDAYPSHFEISDEELDEQKQVDEERAAIMGEELLAVAAS